MGKSKEEIWNEWYKKDLSWTAMAMGAMDEYAAQSSTKRYREVLIDFIKRYWSLWVNSGKSYEEAVDEYLKMDNTLLSSDALKEDETK